MRKAILLAIGGLAFLAGCGSQANKATTAPAEPKWKGAPYRLEFDGKGAKPKAGAFALPPIKFTANPDALETRATLVVRFDTDNLAAAKKGPVVNQEIMAPTDIKGAEGSLPAEYMESASKGIASLLTAYCVKDKAKISVALFRSSLSPGAGDAEMAEKRLSDWLPIELAFKNPHPKC